MRGRKILVVDDDPKMQRLLQYSFTQAGAEVVLATDGEEALRQFYQHRPDLVVLDVMMPKLDGWETCRRIRDLAETPVLIVTARGREEDILRGFENGADDYVTKPFSLQVLVARVGALLHRASLPPVTAAPVIYTDEHLTVDLEANRVLVDGQPVRLTATEYRLLAYLVENAGRVLSPRQIRRRCGAGSMPMMWTTFGCTSGTCARNSSATLRRPSTW